MNIVIAGAGAVGTHLAKMLSRQEHNIMLIDTNQDKLEDLEKQMKKEFDADKRSDLAIQMQQTILDDNAYVFCSHLRMSMIMQSNVTGLTAHPCDYYELTADLDIN